MTLGKQFEDTYWHDDDGVVNFSLKHKYSESDPDSDSLELNTLNVEPDTPFIDNESEESISHQIPEYLGNVMDGEPHLQGMLFSPHTGTGLKDDPLVPTHERERAVREVLGQNPRKTHVAGKLSTRYEDYSPDDFLGEIRHEERGEVLRNSLYHSDIPIHELRALEGHDLVATMHLPSEDRAMQNAGGNYSNIEKRIKVRDHPAYKNISSSMTRTPIASTLLHEYGHARDNTHSEDSSKGKNNLVLKGADPIQEGMADAYSDRYAHNAGKLESGRQASERWYVQYGGYGSNYSQWERETSDGIRDFRSPTKSNTASALYAASRIVSARSDRGMASIPKHLSHGDEEKILAHLWEHNPEIHSTMNEIPQPGPSREPEYTSSLGDHAAQIHAKHFDPQSSRREAFWSHRDPKSEVPIEDRETPPTAKYDEPLPLEGI
jgi:hypothetical protein